MSRPLGMKVDDWPHKDRACWVTACKVAGFLERPGLAAKWSSSRRRITEQAYGQWLAWLEREGLLHPDDGPQQRVSPERLDAFIIELQDRVSSWSVAMMIGALKRMLDVMAPEADWHWLGPVCSDLKQIARPSRNRFGHMVTPRQLFDLGLSMMDEADKNTRRHPMRKAVRARDGLIIAMLICSPVRIANLTRIEIGTHLLHGDGRYHLHFDADETKTGKEFDSDLPLGLTSYIDRYLQCHRPALQALGSAEKTQRLWIDRWGKPMAEGAIRTQIEINTSNAFGRHVWPHLFRAIAVTGMVDEAPEEIGITPDLLGHSSLQTTSKHYILASATRAHQRVQVSFLKERASALRRLQDQRSAKPAQGEAPEPRRGIRIVRKSSKHG